MRRFGYHKGEVPWLGIAMEYDPNLSENDLWTLRKGKKEIARLRDHGESLSLSMCCGPDGAVVDLDLDEVAKLREVLDVWFYHHA